MATNDALRILDQAVIVICIAVMFVITSIFIRRQLNFPSAINVLGGLSSFTCFVISCTATVYLFNPDLPCDFRAYFVSTLYMLCNLFLFFHFFAKSRLLVGIVPEDEGAKEFVIKNPFRKGSSVVLRVIDIVFLSIIVAYFLVGAFNLPTVQGVRSEVTGLCTVGKPGFAQFLNVGLVILGNFMCLFSFVIPLRKLLRRTKLRSTTGKSLERQKRLVMRTCIAIFVSILSLLTLYAILVLGHDSVLATYYIDFMITQSVQLMSIIPPKQTKPGKVAVMSTKVSNSNAGGTSSMAHLRADESRLEYGSDA